MLSIINATYQDNYKILLHFNDKKVGVVNLKDFILNCKLKPFKKLQDVEKFKKFKVDYTLTWDDDLDLAPEYLYFRAFENDEKLKPQFKKIRNSNMDSLPLAQNDFCLSL